MKITTKQYNSGRTTTILEPEQDYQWISNGSVWTDKVVLGLTDSVDNWHDTNIAPPEPEEPSEDELQQPLHV